VQRVVTIMERRGLTAKVSSIHVNGWFGSYDKLATTKRMLEECFGESLDLEREKYAFIGDSPNDGPMFRYFRYAVGVANVRDFPGVSDLPAFVTAARCGEGFREFADFVLRPA
jgi:3-deoxy-D-manno-octulosonate 8-phosphate phosphatase KdsC-like HAD superfamily phosphatase